MKVDEVKFRIDSIEGNLDLDDMEWFVKEARRISLSNEFDPRDYSLVEIINNLWEQGEKAWKYDKLQKDKK